MYFPWYGTFSFWWLFPLVMMVLCFLMMRGRWGSAMCGFRTGGAGCGRTKDSESPLDILDRRYASGEIDEEEYRLRLRTLTESDY